MKISKLALAIIPIIFFSPLAMGSIYIGASSSGNHLNFEQGYGDILAPNGISMANTVFVGSSFSDDLFGLEFGSSFQDSGSVKARIDDDIREFGIPDYTGIGDDDFENKLKLEKLYLEVFKNFHVSDKITLSPYLGVAYVKAKLKVRMILNDGLPVVALVASANDFVAKESKFIPRIGLKMNLNLAKSYGFRFGVGFENTKRLKLKSYDIPARLRNGTNHYPEARLKNTTTVEFGFYVNAF